MPQLLANSLPLLPLALLPAVLLLLAPLRAQRGRTRIAGVLAALGLTLIFDVLVLPHSQLHTLAVPNVFPRGPEREPFRWTTETVTAPAWHWHVFAAAMLLGAAAFVFLRRRRAPRVPSPVLHGAAVFVWYLAVRLGLEKTAAPEPIVWALGGTPSLLAILPFVGWYCGRRGHGFGGFAARLFGMALAQRLVLIAVGFVATTQHLGTHLDTHVVEDISLLFRGETRLGSDVQRWLVPTVVPHLTVWIAITVVVGLLLGSLPFWLARRRAQGALGNAAPVPVAAAGGSR